MNVEYLPHQSPHATIGDLFGKLTVTAIVRRNGRGYAVCDCSCGTKNHTVRIDVLKKGNSRSCGCLITETFTTHGLSKHPLYATWQNMRRRCSDSKLASDKANYIDRNITVCERWHDVTKFIEDMYPTYETGLLLDRIDNNKGYEPGNCRWVNWEIQSTNKRHIELITHDGRTQSLAAWCREYNIRHETVRGRIKKKGWDPVIAITTPVDAKRPNSKPYVYTRKLRSS